MTEITKVPAILVTNCTATQAQEAPAQLRGATLKAGVSTQEAVDEWCARLKSHKPTMTPAELYRGISFRTITKAQVYLQGGSDSMRVVSIGQGLVGMNDKITLYDLSIDPNHQHSLTKIITAEPFSPSFWWMTLGQALRGDPTPLTTLAAKASDQLIVIACSGRFLSLLIDDLTALLNYPECAERLRIIATSSVGLPRGLLPYIIKYDSRINQGSFGNRFDLSQRAATHFLRLLSDDPTTVRGTADDHRALVMSALDKLGPLKPRKRSSSVIVEDDKAVQAVRAAIAKLPSGMSANEAFSKIAAQGLQIAPQEFRRIWVSRGALAAMAGTQKKDSKKVPDEAKMAAALLSMQEMGSIGSGTGVRNSIEDEEKALAVVSVFVDALRSTNADARFSSIDIRDWAAKYCPAVGDAIPRILGDSKAIGRLLKSYDSVIGVAVVVLDGQYGRRQYELIGGEVEETGETEETEEVDDE